MIDPRILQHFPDLSESQQSVVGHLDGPLLVIAGPGSGKTYSIILRALNLLLLDRAQPQNLVLCTFTEKAAYEMRDRLAAAAQKVNYRGDLSQLHISTIHGLCNKLLQQYRHRTQIGHNYEILDDLTQLLFIYEHFDDIVGEPIENKYLGRWSIRWDAIKGVSEYFNKIAEELIDPEDLQKTTDKSFLRDLGRAYVAYRDCLLENNKVDFAHLEILAYKLLLDPELSHTITQNIRYVIVDEYQDTNYIQEQILLKLTERTRNLCVVGDEDQSLYRFRGATVRNILEFPDRVPECKVVHLVTNYRSHKQIIEKYDHWMRSANWSNPKGRPFRYDKFIQPDSKAEHPEYPAVFSVWGTNAEDEARRFVDLVVFLKENEIIEDYSQIALLLHSVRKEHSGHYLNALDKRGIPFFCPRARTYFDNLEVRDLIACFATIFGWDDKRGETVGPSSELAKYVDDSLVKLAKRFAYPSPLAQALAKWRNEIEHLREGESLDMRPADYFYQLLSLEPFKSYTKNENAARNLAIFSQLLNVFQKYYHYTVVTHNNRERLRFHLFNSFFNLLYHTGINEYENPDRPIPKGHVQIMTIHQAKGLEFPIVIVGSLSTKLSSSQNIDRVLAPFYNRPPFEPEDRIALFDQMRLHYVAFSRAQKVLVLTTHETPQEHFRPIWDGLPQWPYVQKEQLAAQRFRLRERIPAKKNYSFTGDLKVYETCPRQYQFFREYDFAPSRSAVIFFGSLVHQTIEDIHRIVLDGKMDILNDRTIRDIFERTYRFLATSDVRLIGEETKEAAFRQVMNYFSQNRERMRRIIDIEVDVSLEKENYILVGKIDLLLGNDGKLELLDFKTSPRPKDNQKFIDAYEHQLNTYAYILEQRYGERVDRLLLYWTSEPSLEDALMVLPYNPTKVEEAGRYFDAIVHRIQSKDFNIQAPPESKICTECDLRLLCHADGIIAKPN
ncbi:MAG: ATP-dependent DNA helicase [Candidatus Methanomethylicaceae archaeon]